ARSAWRVVGGGAPPGGRQPPTGPRTKGKGSAGKAIPGGRTKGKERPEKVGKLIGEKDGSCMNEAGTRPAAPPTSPRSSDSKRKAPSTARRVNPSARSVPISPTRFATEAYIVIIAPIIAPIEKMADSVNPRMLMKFDSTRDWSL